MEIRKFDKGDIFYIILIDDYNIQQPFTVPENLSNRLLDIVKFLPKNIYQILNPELYLQYQLNSIEFNPYKVLFIKRTDEIEIFRLLKEIINLKIIILESDKDKLISGKIEDQKLETAIIVSINNDSLASEMDKVLSSLVFQVDYWIDKLRLAVVNTNGLSVKIDSTNLNKTEYFAPARNNYLIHNNAVGNFLFGHRDDEKKIVAEQKQAISNPDSFVRLNRFLNQLICIDKLTEANSHLSSSLLYEAFPNPIVITLPFHNPDILDFFEGPVDKQLKDWISIIQPEQTSNYVSSISSEKAYFLQSGVKYIKNKLGILDNIGFLISSFRLSSYVRLPMLGKSIYKELSFLSPKNFNKFITVKAQNKISDTILKIGNKISSKVMSPDFIKYLSKRNSQIISISDLPFEWTTLNDIPISFTHDITRLPETTYNNLIQSYALNSTFEYTISKDIIKNTVVVIGTEDENFKKWHEFLFEKSIELGFKVKKCLSIKDFVGTIKELKPEFLIIDSHGGYDKKTKSTFLELGNEQLNTDHIIKNDINIPLVFLSACGTSPIYGTHNTLANSFLQMGSKSITSTYLPIDIDNSTIIYLTILNNLDSTAKKGSFNNWLEYISYNIRSSFLHRTFVPISLKRPELEKKYQKLIQDLLYFSKRRHVYKEVKKIQSTLPSKEYKSIKSNAYEFLYYSNTGRGDLILFDAYQSRFLGRYS